MARGGAGHRLEVLQRARSLALAMRDAGDDAELIEPQLVAVGIPGTTAAEAVELLRGDELALDWQLSEAMPVPCCL